MILRLLTALVFTAPAAATRPVKSHAAPQVRADGAGPDAAGAKCRLTRRRSPALLGFRLGMSAAQVAGRFPEFPDLARFDRAENSPEWKDASGALALSGGASGLGVSVLRVEGRYFRQRPPRGALLPGEFQWLDLRFLDGRLVVIHARDWVSPLWENVDALKAWIERSYGLTPYPWRTTRQEKPPGVTYFDFQTVTHSIDCDGFVVAASCVGPPAPPNICDIEISDPAVPKIVEARRAAAPKRGRKK